MSHYYPGEPSTWYTNGAIASPLSTSPLADTGQVASVDNYLAQIVISADNAAVVAIQHRDAANATNVTEQRIYVGANGTASLWLPCRIDTANERYRLIPASNVSPGNVSGSILFQKMK